MTKFIERLTKIAVALLLALGFIGSLAPLAYADEFNLALAEIPAATEAVQPAGQKPDTKALMAELRKELETDLETRLAAELADAKPHNQ